VRFDVTLLNSMHVVAMTQPWEHALTGADIVRAARLADELGYWKLLTGEHFIIPKSHVPLSGDHYLHSVAALSFVATAAPRMKLSSSVTILPLQNPIVQAKAWATLDWLSGGRAVALVGVGWLEEEYRMLNVPFHERGRLCDEYIAAMIELWTSDSPQFEGKYVSFKDVGFAPKPVQKPHLPLWCGGDADNVLKRVALWGSGWSPFRTKPENFPERLDFIRSQRDYHGRPLEMMFAMSMLNVGDAHAVTGDPRAQGLWDAQKIIDQCHWLKGLGVTEVVVPLPPLQDFEAYLDRLRWIAAEVMPKVD
jgi:probable F420-dependent oxidoreductase